MINYLYTGRAGHFAVMAELLLRGWNVAIPEVDVGDDIFVVEDEERDLKSVQVKTALLKRGQYQFKAPLRQLRDPRNDLTYVFALRTVDASWRFIVFSRRVLEDLYGNGFGTLLEEAVMFRVTHETDGLPAFLGSQRMAPDDKGKNRYQKPIVLDQYVSNWADFPIPERFAAPTPDEAEDE